MSKLMAWSEQIVIIHVQLSKPVLPSLCRVLLFEKAMEFIANEPQIAFGALPEIANDRDAELGKYRTQFTR